MGFTEWFWPRDDPSVYGQLCWSNASLVSFIESQVKSFLRSQPDATIISVSQNDNGHYCNSSAEREVMIAEGSPMGPLLRAVNQVADAISEEFPHVVVDTLAYQVSSHCCGAAGLTNELTLLWCRKPLLCGHGLHDGIATALIALRLTLAAVDCTFSTHVLLRRLQSQGRML